MRRSRREPLGSFAVVALLLAFILGCEATPSTAAVPCDRGPLFASPARLTLGPGASRSIELMRVTGPWTEAERRAASDALEPESVSVELVKNGLAAHSTDERILEVVLRADGPRVIALVAGEASVVFEHADTACRLDVLVDMALSPFAREVVDFEPGVGAGFGQDRLPDVVLGPPHGAGEHAGSMDVLSLGRGGTVELGFGDLIGYDGPGADLLVFENAFRSASGQLLFAETATVAVSSVASFASRSEAWRTFPCEASTSTSSGCAGVNPVLADGLVMRDFTDPVASGGDRFDLAVLTSRAPFDRVRITDSKNIPDVFQGSAAAQVGPALGFDLDAVALIHGLPIDTLRLEFVPDAPDSVPSCVGHPLRVGSVARVPDVSAVRVFGARIEGLEVEFEVEGEAVRLDGRRVHALAPGTATISASAGPHSVTCRWEVRP